MTIDEARALTKGERVYYGSDCSDRGVVTDVAGELVAIRWRGDASDSCHWTTRMQQVHRVRRGRRRREGIHGES